MHQMGLVITTSLSLHYITGTYLSTLKLAHYILAFIKTHSIWYSYKHSLQIHSITSTHVYTTMYLALTEAYSITGTHRSILKKLALGLT